MEPKTLLGKIWRILTLNCDQSALLASQGLDRHLSWWEKVALKAHLAICAKSRRLSRHLVQLNTSLMKNQDHAYPLGGMPSETRERIREKLKSIR